MPRLIFKCPYIKGGTSAACSHLENYVQYAEQVKLLCSNELMRVIIDHAQQIGISQKGVNKRRQKVLDKLRTMMKAK